MADDQEFEMWDDEFLEKAIQLTEAAVCSSVSNPTQPPPPPPQQLPPPPSPPHSAPYISFSPPRELSQRVNGDNHRNVPNKGFDCPVSFNGINQGLNGPLPFPHSSRLHDQDKCSKQQEIIRLKEELGRVSKELTNLEQECSELRKERDKNEIHLRSVPPLNGSTDSEASCTKKSKLKNKDPIEDHSVIHPGSKGIIPCKAVGVQTDEHSISTDLTIKKDQSVAYPSRKLAGIWESQNDQPPRTNLGFKLFVACEADLQVLFGCLGLSMPSNLTTTNMRHDSLHKAANDCIQTFDALKVSHLYLTLTKISYDIGKLEDLLEALVDLFCLQNAGTNALLSTCADQSALLKLEGTFSGLRNSFSLTEDDRSQISLRSACGLETHFEYGKQVLQQCTVLRDNVIVDDPSTVNRSSERHSEMAHLLCGNTKEPPNPLHPALTRFTSAKKVWNKNMLGDDSSPLISSSKWFSLYQIMHQIVTRPGEEIIREKAVSIMNIIILRADAYGEREMYGDMLVFQTISQLLRKEAGIGVQKQTVHLLYLLLNCPKLMSIFCSSCKEEGRSAKVPTANAESAPVFQGMGAILDGVADCLACRGNGAPTMVLKLQRKTIILLAFLASSRFEILLGDNLPKMTNFLYLILQILASEIDVEGLDDFRERRLVIREALILLNRLASNPQYSTPVLRGLLTSTREMACLTIEIGSRLSRKGNWWGKGQADMEIVDLAWSFKKRVLAFLSEKKITCVKEEAG